MPRRNSQDWSAGDDVAGSRLHDINQDLDDLYTYGSDRGRIVSAASADPLAIDIGAFGYRVGDTHGVFAGDTDIAVTDDATNYVMIEEDGDILVNTTGWLATNARLGVVVAASGSIVSITLWRPDVFGGDLGNDNPQVNVQTLSGNLTLNTASDTVQHLDANGTDRDITLEDTAMPEGTSFYLKNAGTSGDLAIKQDAATLITLYPGHSCVAHFDGTDWKIMLNVSDERFGDGRDGALNVTSGTTQIDCSGHVQGIVLKQYTSFNVSGGATLEFTNVPDMGILFVVLVQGAYAMAGTIDGQGDGSKGGAGVTQSRTSNGGSNVSGNPATEISDYLRCGQTRRGGGGSGDFGNDGGSGVYAAASGGGSGASSTADGNAASNGVTTGTVRTATGGTAGASLTTALLKMLATLTSGITLAPGAGGGSGGLSYHNNGYSSGTFTATSMDGGRGGLSMYVRCGGNFSQTGTVNFSGTSASNSTSSSGTNAGTNQGHANAAGGSAGGTAGDFFAEVAGTITDSATYTLNGGTGGTGSSTQSGTGGGAGSNAGKSNGANGANGSHAVVPIR